MEFWDFPDAQSKLWAVALPLDDVNLGRLLPSVSRKEGVPSQSDRTKIVSLVDTGRDSVGVSGEFLSTPKLFDWLSSWLTICCSIHWS
jgi:hypothetical protein